MKNFAWKSKPDPELSQKKKERMVTTITASYTVIPNEPTPNGHFWLSDMDQIFQPHYTRTIYIYKLAKLENYKEKEDVIERMRRSLSKILVHYYPMAGRLCWSTTTSTPRIELDLNAKGAVLLEAETTKNMSDYGDFAPSDSTKDLVPSIDYTQPMEDLPLLVVQLTRFPHNEGLAVGVAFSHALSDGLGNSRFINSWAKIARGGGGGGDDTQLEPHEIPFLDRTILKFPNPELAPPPPPPRFEHTAFKPLPLILGRSDNTVERNKKTTAALLRLTAEQVEKLKEKANKNDDDDDQFQLVPKQQRSSRPYSRYEAIAAHMWRCASKARELNENQPTAIRYPVEIRNRMIPPLPGNYFGNALSMAVARDYVGEITSKPLSYVAQKIREASELVINEYIRSEMDVIRGQKNLDDARALFLGVKEEGKDNNNNNNNIAPFFGNPNLHITSWMSMPMHETDFGWGKPMHVGIATLCPYDRGLILFSPDGDGSVIVSMHFQIAYMQLFNKFFYEDI